MNIEFLFTGAMVGILLDGAYQGDRAGCYVCALEHWYGAYPYDNGQYLKLTMRLA